MRKIMLALSMAVALAAMTGCKDNPYKDERHAMDDQMRQERKFMDQAIKDHSPDVQRVDLIDSTVVYTHIYDGIIDIKAYTFSGKWKCYSNHHCQGGLRRFLFPFLFI